MNRLLALLLLLMLPLLAWYAVGEPLRNEYVLGQRLLASEQEHLLRVEAIASQLGDYQSKLRRQRLDQGLSRAVFQAGTETLAAAIVQQRVKSVVEARGGSLVSTQVLQTVAAAPFTRIRINVRMLLSVPVLQRVLHDIEAQIPYLVVDQMLITKRHWRRTNKRSQAQLSESLDVRIVISGFWQSLAMVPGSG